eukprot:TRINITY_DN82820_c0_g1_i1.p1 TRINITY_DN82820_c0_g1~~TRINITY_DN82820_c0_g1_i1.p1  ORF type:complete len:198 (+),score=28.86 TRINITY_DN82820_c0_g1_i1:36-629(+)
MPKEARKTSAKKQKQGFGASQFAVPIVVALLAFAASQAPQYVPVQPAPNRLYHSWEEFFPFYLTEHSEVTNQQLHFVGTTFVILMGIACPWIFISLGLAGYLGFSLAPLCAGMTTGAVEGAGAILTYVLCARLLSRRWWPALAVPLVGYGFAWVGHFMFEKNRPATFVYPSYSLFSDFVMWYRIATGQIPAFYSKSV